LSRTRTIVWARHVICIEEIRNGHKMLIIKSEGKRPLQRAGHKLEDNVKVDLKEIGYMGADWIHQTLGKWSSI
jgi:hypothetical protein